LPAFASGFAFGSRTALPALASGFAFGSRSDCPRSPPGRSYDCRVKWDELRDYCLAKPGAWPDEPWGDGVVTKVGQKIFAFLRSVGPGGEALGVGVKCGASREAADEWLLRFPGDAAVMPYIGRSGWNSLSIGGAIPDDEILEAIDASYAMVVSKLPKKDRPASLPGRRPPPADGQPVG
jgi:predicted DNA-binding protein (MmcQ/YjbR family)